jgi:hypothetical protein
MPVGKRILRPTIKLPSANATRENWLRNTLASQTTFDSSLQPDHARTDSTPSLGIDRKAANPVPHRSCAVNSRTTGCPAKLRHDASFVIHAQPASPHKTFYLIPML